MSTIEEHDRVILTVDLPAIGLMAGDVGTIVHVHSEGAAFEVEFVALGGQTIVVATLEHIQVRPVAHREITHAQHVA